MLSYVRSSQKEKESWYILIIFNPNNRRAAVESFLNNYKYLHERTGDVKYFIPGMMNDPELNGDLLKSNGLFMSKVELTDKSLLNVKFDRKGLLDTIDWLEKNCPNYEYKEGIDIVMLKAYYEDRTTELYVHNLLCIPLEEIYQSGLNIIANTKTYTTWSIVFDMTL